MAVTSKLSTTDSKLNVSMKLATRSLSQSASNTLTVSQSSSTGESRSVSQSLTITQVVAVGATYSRSVSQSLGISQDLLDFTAQLGTTSSRWGHLIFGGHWFIPFDNSPEISQSLVITQSVIVEQSDRRVNQSLTITQTVASINTLNLSVSNSLALIQVADEFKLKPRSISQSLTITELAESVKTNGFSNSLTITQSVDAVLDPHLELTLQTLTITQAAVAQAIRPRTISQPLTIAQVIDKTKIITRSVTQSLAIAQTTASPVNTATHTSLTLAQVIAVVILRNNPIATQSLHITQSVNVNLILTRSLTSTLVFLNYHEVPNGQGGFISIPNLLYSKGGPSDNACCPVSGGSTFFQAPSRAIVLPNPEFGDGESNVAAVKIIRTITGGTFSYVKKSVNRKLKYKFHINQRKAFELRQFLLDFMATRLTMTNWKGEMWNGYFLSDPAEITSIGRGDTCIGDLYEVELDFQGIRIN